MNSYDNLLDLVVQVGTKLIAQRLKLVTIESCTGGMLAAALTEIAGSSAYFERGFVTYSDAAKMELVGVDAALLQQFGAVSAEVAAAMARGGLSNSQAQVSVAITGIAGPSGATQDKPVGTVYFAWQVGSAQVVIERQNFSGMRSAVRGQSAEYALQKLLELLDEEK